MLVKYMKKLVLQGKRVAPNEIWISKLMWHLSIYKTPWRLISTESGIESSPKYLMIYLWVRRFERDCGYQGGVTF